MQGKAGNAMGVATIPIEGRTHSRRAPEVAARALRVGLSLASLAVPTPAPPALALSADSWQGSPAPADWQQQIRARVNAGQLGVALAIADQRLAEAPQDLEARSWRARLLARSGRLSEAEAEYRSVLASVPDDTDILAELSDVLIRQQRFDEALALLARAQALDPARSDLPPRRGRALRALGRTAEAREAFAAALALDPRNAEAKEGLASLRPEPRHQLRIGTDTDFFNFTDTAQAQTVSLRAQWGSRWTTVFAANFYQRFGQDAGKFTGSATYRLGRPDALTVGGAVGHDRGIIPKREAFVEYGHGFRPSDTGLLRGVETSYRQQWLWFASARVFALMPSAIFYLPRDWTWSLAVTAARSSFPGVGVEWRPSGLTRLTFPLHRRWTGNLFYGVGTENFAQVDQIGRFSARTFGGGARCQLTPRQDLAGYVAYQNRSQGHTQTSFGLSYGLRF